MLDQDTNVNAISAEGKSVLIIAATQRRTYPAVKLLLLKGARVAPQQRKPLF